VQEGDSAYMPPGHGHLIINTGETWMVTTDDSPVDGAGDSASMPGHADYESVKKMRGFAYYVVAREGGPALLKNPAYREVRTVDFGGLSVTE